MAGLCKFLKISFLALASTFILVTSLQALDIYSSSGQSFGGGQQGSSECIKSHYETRWKYIQKCSRNGCGREKVSYQIWVCDEYKKVSNPPETKPPAGDPGVNTCYNPCPNANNCCGPTQGCYKGTCYNGNIGCKSCKTNQICVQTKKAPYYACQDIKCSTVDPCANNGNCGDKKECKVVTDQAGCKVKKCEDKKCPEVDCEVNNGGCRITQSCEKKEGQGVDGCDVAECSCIETDPCGKVNADIPYPCESAELCFPLSDNPVSEYAKEDTDCYSGQVVCECWGENKTKNEDGICVCDENSMPYGRGNCRLCNKEEGEVRYVFQSEYGERVDCVRCTGTNREFARDENGDFIITDGGIFSLPGPKCKCIEGYIPVAEDSNDCEPCPDNTKPDKDQLVCIADCVDGKINDPEDPNKCICPSGSEPDGDNCKPKVEPSPCFGQTTDPCDKNPCGIGQKCESDRIGENCYNVDYDCHPEEQPSVRPECIEGQRLNPCDAKPCGIGQECQGQMVLPLAEKPEEQCWSLDYSCPETTPDP